MDLIRTPNSNSKVSYTAFCHQLGQKTTPNLMRQIFQIFDINEDNFLNFRELLYSLDSATNGDMMNRIKLMFQIFSAKKPEIAPKSFETIFDDIMTMFPTIKIPKDMRNKMIEECYTVNSVSENDLESNISGGVVDREKTYPRLSPRTHIGPTKESKVDKLKWEQVTGTNKIQSDKLVYKTVPVPEEKSEDLEEYIDGGSTKKQLAYNGETKGEDFDQGATLGLPLLDSQNNTKPLTP